MRRGLSWFRRCWMMWNRRLNSDAYSRQIFCSGAAMPAHAEFRSLLDSVERLLKPSSRAAGNAASVLQAHKPASSAAVSRLGPFKFFAMGAIFALLVVGGFWLYVKAGKGGTAGVSMVRPRRTHPHQYHRQRPIQQVRIPKPHLIPPPLRPAVPPPVDGSICYPRSTVGQLLAASSEKWKLLIDGKEDDYAWTDNGFGVFGFRDGKTALVDTFALLIPGQTDLNIKDFELLAGNGGPTGPFESIGRFSTQNMRMMHNPYQEFRFPPVKLKYLKFQPLRSHADSTSMYAFEVQLFGELQ